MKKILLSLLLVVSLAVPFVSRADDNEAKNEVRDARTTVRGEITNLKEQYEKDREAAAHAIEARRESLEKQFEADREAMKQEVEKRREAMKQEVEKRREELKSHIEKIQDDAKRTVATRLDASLQELNADTLEKYTENVAQLDRVLVNIASRTDKADARGLNVAAVRTAIASAKTAIAAARTAITAQAAKSYVATASTTVTTSTATSVLKQAFLSARNLLVQDLRAVRSAVVAARDAVHTAAVALAQIPRVDEATVTTSTPPVPTSTATSSH